MTQHELVKLFSKSVLICSPEYGVYVSSGADFPLSDAEICFPDSSKYFLSYYDQFCILEVFIDEKLICIVISFI